jgi:glycosyltransferase involved in cell wall biosynthesis
LKKVLIISYFFPPANFVGGERVYAWAKHLHMYGYHPVIITRCWNENQVDIVSKVHRNEFSHEVYENYEVYRLPYKRSVRDFLSQYSRLHLLQKALTFIELILSNFFIKVLPFSNFYSFSRELLEKDQSITTVIISGRPFQSFFLGYKLKKKFPINWIPDYRDEWTSHQVIKPKNSLWKIIHLLEQMSEKKWTSNSDAFIGVSDYWVKRIGAHIGKNGVVVKNGFTGVSELSSIPYSSNSDNFYITYVGTLYPYQNIEILIDSVNQVNQATGNKIHLNFVGINVIPEQEKRAKIASSKLLPNVKFIPRVSKEELASITATSDLLFLTGYEGLKGCYPVKLFEYAISGRPLLLCPTDNDVIEKFILETNCGYIANEIESCISILEQLLINKQTGVTGKEVNVKEINKYSREFQTGILASFLDKMN